MLGLSQNHYRKVSENGSITYAVFCYQLALNLLDAASTHHLFEITHSLVAFMLFLPSVFLSFCSFTWSWQLTSFPFSFVPSDLLVLMSNVCAFCWFSSCKTGLIWLAAEFAFKINVCLVSRLFNSSARHGADVSPPQQRMPKHFSFYVF